MNIKICFKSVTIPTNTALSNFSQKEWKIEQHSSSLKVAGSSQKYSATEWISESSSLREASMSASWLVAIYMNNKNRSQQWSQVLHQTSQVTTVQAHLKKLLRLMLQIRLLAGMCLCFLRFYHFSLKVHFYFLFLYSENKNRQRCRACWEF